MSRARQGINGDLFLEPPSPKELEAAQQAADGDTLMRAKALLCELWKANRITAEARFMGENILAAALHAIENPSLTKLGTTQGAKLAQHQWAREQERANEPF